MTEAFNIEAIRTLFDILNSACLAAESLFIGIKIHRLRKVKDARAISIACELFFTGWSVLSVGFYLSIPRLWSAAACFVATITLAIFTYTAWRMQRQAAITHTDEKAP